MKCFDFSLCFLSFFLLCLISYSSFSMEEDIVFELKREIKKSKQKTRKKKTLPEKFRRQSFSYGKDFLIYNKKPSSSLEKGTALRVNIPYPVIASFTEEFPVFGIITFPFKGVLSGKIKALKNTNKASIVFNEMIVNGEKMTTQSFPIFITGDLKESLFKDIAINFFESLPAVLGLAIRTQIPQTGLHFINTDLQNKLGKLPSLETEKRKRLQYLEFQNIKLLTVVIK